MVEWKNQREKFPIEGDGDHYDNEVEIAEEELSPYYEDLLYEEWRDRQILKKKESNNW